MTWRPLLGSGRHPRGAILRWVLPDGGVAEGMGITAHMPGTHETGAQYSVACVDRYGYAMARDLWYLDEPDEVWEKRFREFDWDEFYRFSRNYPQA